MTAKEQRGYVETAVGLIHYRSQGSGPPVVLLHQTAWNSAQYRHILPLLAGAGFRAIALDTPGYGMSEAPASQPSIEDYAGFALEAISQLGLEVVSLVGHHTGASIAAQAAAQAPDTVDHLVLHGPPLYTAEESTERLARPHFDQTPQPDGSHFTGRWEILARVAGRDAELTSMHESLLHFFGAGEKEYYGHVAAWRFDLAEPLARLKARTLILSNSGDAIHHFAQRVLELRPDFQYTELTGGNHFFLTEQPARWSEAVIDFLRRTRTL
jgi:pimeloyl-ACP methyl ester carboxylesterase